MRIVAEQNLNLTRFPRRLIVRLATAIVVAVAFVAGAWHEHVPLLREAASLWIVSDPLTPSDVAVVLGGGVKARAVVAAELYKKGLVTKVLVSQVPGRDTEQHRMVLLELGVPETAIETFGQANHSTKDEAVSLRNWADQHQVSRIIIPTEIFTARRVRWIFHREFAGSSVRLEVPSYDGPHYTRRAWWRTGNGVVAFKTELIKYLYYRLEY